MKKFKKCLVLGLTAIATMSIASCSITAKDDLVLTYTYTNGDGVKTEKSINAEDVYQRYLKSNPKDHAKAYYDAINEVAVRVAFMDGGTLAKYKTEIEDATQQVITTDKNKADEEGTDWDDYLTSLGYTDSNMSTDEKEHELYLDTSLTKMEAKVKSQFKDSFNTWKKDSTDENASKYNLIWGDDGYIKENMPFAVRHILVKAGDSSDNFTGSKITEDAALKLSRVLKKLTQTDGKDTTFATIATTETDDTGSATQGGLYAMSTATSFVNEFKLGVYTYEAIYKQSEVTKYNDYLTSKAASTTFTGFNLTDSTKNDISKIGVNFIPYEAVDLLSSLSNVTSYNGLKVNNGNESYYPRNIIFNEYFNNHNISFITDESINANLQASDAHTFDDTGETYWNDLDANGKIRTSGTTYSGLTTIQKTHFKEVTIDGQTKNVLCDDNGKPIMLALNASSSGGVHIMTLDRGFFDGTLNTTSGEYVTEEKLSDGTTYTVSQSEYYANEVPITNNGVDSQGNPLYNSDKIPMVEGKNVPKRTFMYNDVVMNKSNYDDYLTNTLQKDIDGSYASSLQTVNQYKWLKANANIKAKDTTAQNLIDMYEVNQTVTTNKTNSDTLITAWDSYYQTLDKQENSRSTGLIPVTCALNYGRTDVDDPNGNGLYEKGGACYNTGSINQ
jgi:hypothetical protein